MSIQIKNRSGVDGRVRKLGCIHFKWILGAVIINLRRVPPEFTGKQRRVTRRSVVKYHDDNQRYPNCQPDEQKREHGFFLSKTYSYNAPDAKISAKSPINGVFTIEGGISKTSCCFVGSPARRQAGVLGGFPCPLPLSYETFPLNHETLPLSYGPTVDLAKATQETNTHSEQNNLVAQKRITKFSIVVFSVEKMPFDSYTFATDKKKASKNPRI